MPSVSAKQALLMSAVAHGWVPKGEDSPPVPMKVANEFHEADVEKGKFMHRKKIAHAMHKRGMKK